MCKKLIYLISLVVLLSIAGDASAELILHWSFDEGSGTVANDQSGNGRNGTIEGNPIWVTGKIGGALEFTGDGSRVVDDDGETYINGLSALTVSMWIKSDVTNTDKGFLHCITPSGQDRVVGIRYDASGASHGGSSVLKMGVESTGGEQQLESSANLQTTEWQHVAMTWESGGLIRLYINGLEDTPTGRNNPNNDGTVSACETLIIGQGGKFNDGSGGGWDGLIDDVRFYDTALSAEEIQAAMVGQAFPYALGPNPADGSIIETTWVSLGWSPGDFAASHNVYMSDNFDDVNDGTPDSPAFQRNLTDTLLIAGFFGYPFPDGLVPGTTYYWRVDEVNDADPNSPWVGSIWSFSIPSRTAYDPIPADGANFVSTDVELSWTIGLNAKLHNIVFGDNFDDVNNAPAGSPVVDTTFTPTALEAGKTYYWRVDEVDPPTTVKGNVWSFTTIPEIPITDPNLVAWWTFDEGDGALALDWSGHGNHATLVGSEWLDGKYGDSGLHIGSYGAIENLSYAATDLTEVTVAAWIRTTSGGDQYIVSFDRNEYYRLEINGNGGGTGQVGWDVMTSSGQIDYGSVSRVDDGGWHHVVGVYDSGLMTIYIDGVAELSTTGGATYGSGNTRFGFIGANSEATGFDGSRGSGAPVSGEVDDIRIYDRALAQQEILLVMRGDLRLAWSPVPADGSMAAINFATPLTWSAGDGASQHDVYFGMDQAAVAEADASDTTGVYVGRQNATSYTPAGITFDSGPFYWRIDEVANDGTTVKGGVWSFSVTDHALVDDFESYNEILSGEPGSNLVYETWNDGYANPNINGSAMGNISGASMETGNVHGGRQSVPFIFNNTTAPVSEVTLNFTPAQDWTANGIITLSLWFAGAGTNVPGQLYVKINGVQVNYDGDASNLTLSPWQVWNIDLTAIGTNMSSVTSFAIGIQGSGATGTLLLDDIRLYTLPRELITPVQPDPAGLLLHLALNEGFGTVADDSSGNGRNATISGATWRVGGYNGTGSCLDFSGGGDHVLGDDATYLNDLSAITFSVWVKSDLIDTDKGFLIFSEPTGGDNNGMRYDAAGANGGGTNVLKMSVVSTGGNQQLESSNNLQTTEWQHYALVWSSGEQLRFYVNGVLDSPTDNYAATTGVTTDFEKLLLGKGGKDEGVGDSWDGLIDDLRIYDRPLSHAEVSGLAGRVNPFDEPF